MAKRLTIEEFIKRARKIHDNKYIYDKVNYKNMVTKVEIICPVHGSFWQTPRVHLFDKCGCPYCAGNKKATKEEFIEKARQVHGDKYDYSKVNYINTNTKVEIICPIHGSFWQTPNKHINYKQGCSACSGVKKVIKEEFIKKARQVHGNRYDYSLVNFINMRTKVKIKCNVCGYIFEQIPRNHINQKHGCPYCKTSKGEQRILDFLNKNDINYVYQYKVKINDKLHIFDFYLPDYNIMIEYQGKQHYKPVDFKGKGKQYALKQYEERIERDNEKREFCLNEGIQLFEIPYWEFNNIENILSDELLLKYVS